MGEYVGTFSLYFYQLVYTNWSIQFSHLHRTQPCRDTHDQDLSNGDDRDLPVRTNAVLLEPFKQETELRLHVDLLRPQVQPCDEFKR